MTYVLLHHTGCGTSKKGLALLAEKGIHPEVRKYMTKAEQLSEPELRAIAKKLGAVGPRAFLRDKDALTFDIADTASDDDVFAAMADNPLLIQRPIGINGSAAALGRPVEKLLDII